MKLIDRILMATDFLEESEYVIAQALHLAQKFESEIIPMYVLPENLKDDKVKRMLEGTVETKMTELQKRLSQAGVRAGEPIVLPGRAYVAIVDSAERVDANVIIIGAGARTEGDKKQLGVTAGRIIRRSDKPVWVVKPNQSPGVKTILCPIDFSEPSELALKNAIAIARRFEAELIVFSVYEPTSSRGTAYAEEWEAQGRLGLSEYRTQLGKHLLQFNWHGVKWEKEVRSGAPETEILDAIYRHQADLLCMGATGRSGLQRLIMGSVTEKVIREIPCNFIITKSEDVIKLQLEKTIRDINSQYQIANQLMQEGFLEEAIHEFKICLGISDMHLPTLFGLAKTYEKLGETEIAENYRKMAQDVLKSMWEAGIEEDIRKGRTGL